MISGTPSAVGSSPFTASVRDAAGILASDSYVLSVSSSVSPSISSVTPTSGPVNGGTAVQISGTNFRSGQMIHFGNLPAMAIQVLSPSRIQTITPQEQIGPVNVSVSDPDGPTATAANAFTFTTTALRIATSSIPSAIVGSNYSYELAASGGVPPYRWQITAGLPAGFQLDPASGTVLGTPTQSGTYPFTAQVQDSKGAFSTGGFLLDVESEPSVAGKTTWDPSVLGVSWASDFNGIAANQINVKTDSRLKLRAAGDGATDDTGAVRAAIQLASSTGGGTVYFPPGDYKVIASSDSAKASPLVVPSQVILRGADENKSRLYVYDYESSRETDNIMTWGGIEFKNASQAGITDLGIYAMNSAGSACAVLWNRGSTKASELFFNNVDVHLANGKPFWFESTDRLLIQKSRFDGNATQNGPIYAVGNSNISLIGNTITYNFGHVHLENNSNLLFQSNSLTRDAQSKDQQKGSAIESGGIELSFSQNLQILNNTIQTLNAPADQFDDGEAIMSQHSNKQDVLDAGTVTGSSANTLTDNAALWGGITATRLSLHQTVVAITTGSKTGEWHLVQGLNPGAKTLLLAEPWSSTPEVGSHYAVFSWTLMHANIQGNTLVDNPHGIVLFDGCYDCTVQGNILTNSREIVIRVVDEQPSHSVYPEGRLAHLLALDSKILNNVVSNTSGVRPAFIALDAEAFSRSSYTGMGMMRIQVGGNTVHPFSSNPSQSYGQGEITQDGLFPCFLFGPALVKAPVSVVFQNINFWNNSQNAAVAYERSFAVYTTQSCITPSAP